MDRTHIQSEGTTLVPDKYLPEIEATPVKDRAPAWGSIFTAAVVMCASCLVILLCARGEAQVTTLDSTIVPPTQRTVLTDYARRVKRRRQFTARGIPYGVTGIPVALVSSDREFTIGGRLHLTDLQVAPFRYKVIARWLRDPQTGHRYAIRWRVPYIGERFGLLVAADTGRGHGNFFGFGNDTDPINESDVSRYDIRRRNIAFQLRRETIPEYWVALGGAWRETDVDASLTSFLRTNEPGQLGETEARSISISTGVDTRNDPANPTEGVVHIWSIERTTCGKCARQPPAYRWTFQDRRYYDVTSRVSVMARNLFEVVDGELPIDLYGELGDPGRRVRGVGGDGSVRGLSKSRYMDDVRFVTGAEVHYLADSRFWMKQFLELRFAVFADAGRVWHRLSDVRLSPMHSGVGAGLRLTWDRDFVIRSEVARAAEGTTLLLRLSRPY